MVGILRPYVLDVLAGLDWLDECITYERRTSDPQLSSWALVKQLRVRQLDSVILLTNSLRAALIAWASGAPQRIGYVRYGRGSLLTERLYAPREGFGYRPISAVDYYLQLAYAVGSPPASRRLELATLPSDDQRAERLWTRRGFPKRGRIVALSSGAAHGSAKRWPPEYFAELARRMAGELDASLLVICGPDDREIADDIVRMADCDRVQSLTREPTSIGLSKAVVRRCQLLITNDSGPRHIAAAFGVPSITLFGPTDPLWSENYHPQDLHLRRPVPCAPCGRRRCPLAHHRCMRELTVDSVFDAAAQMLRTTPSRTAA
jgi:heptosyltransferase-2